MAFKAFVSGQANRSEEAWEGSMGGFHPREIANLGTLFQEESADQESRKLLTTKANQNQEKNLQRKS